LYVHEDRVAEKYLFYPRGIVYSLSFSHDGSVIASGSADSTVRIWDASKLANTSTTTKSETSGNDSYGGEKNSSKKFFFNLTSFFVFRKENDLLGTFRTKNTPVQLVRFTHRNILLVAGAYTL